MGSFDNSAPSGHWRSIVSMAQEAPFGVMILDAEGRILWENDALRRMFGFGPEQLSPALGMKVTDLPNLRAAGASEMFETLIAGGRLRNLLLDFKTLHGRDVSVSFDAGPVRGDDGGIAGYWLIGQETISDAAPQAGRMIAVQRMEILGLAVTGVIHDLNNILTAMSGSLEMVRGGQQAGPKLVAALDGMVRRSRDIAGRLLEVARPGDNEHEAMDLRTPVRQAADLLRNGLGPDIQIDLSLPAHQVPALCNRTLLLQCLFNLGTNARDAMGGAGNIKIDLLVIRDRGECERRGWPGRRYARLLFRDDGPGIPADKAGRIFEPFFTTKGGKGTGMGLAVVHRAVVDHSGTVDLIPSDSGALFRIELPLFVGPVEDDEPTRTLTIPAPLRKDGPPLEGMRVLVADDEEALRLMLQAALTLRGAEVTAVENGPLALAALQVALDAGTPFHAALIDMRMPGLHGIDLLTALRGRAPGPSLIASSGLEPTPDDAEELRALRVTFLPKPFGLSTVVETILAR